MKNYFLVFGSLTMVVLLIAASAPGALNNPLPVQEPDPCAGTQGAGAVHDRVCLEQTTLWVAEGPVDDVATFTHEGTRVVTFTVLTSTPYGSPAAPNGPVVKDPRVLLEREDGTWSHPLPGSTDLLLRYAGDVAEALDGRRSGNDPYRIVGFTTPLTTLWRDTLEDHGVTLHSYLPVNHAIARLGEDADENALLALPFVHAVHPIDPATKVEPGLISSEDPLLIHVLTMPGVGGALDSVEQRALDLGGEILKREAPLDRLTVKIDPLAVAELALHPQVMWINPTSNEAENDMNIIRQRTGAEASAAAPYGFDGTGVAGQVMDSGLDDDHPDFQDCLLEIDGNYIVSYHGTAVFGIVCGDGTGNSDAVGMAPGARVSFAWYSSGMSRYEHAQNLADRWDGVFQTHSWGRGIPKDNTYDSHSVEMDRIVEDLDVLGLQSMSNCGPECARREAMAKNIISVGALYHQDQVSLDNDYWWGGSRASTGPAADGRIKPELAGPYDRILTTTIDGYMTGFGGTSGATPVNAGSVAIVHQMMAEDHFGPHPTGTGSPAAAKALLTASAHTYQPDQVEHLAGPDKWTFEPYKRDVQGWGAPRLDRLAEAGDQVLLVDNENPIATGDVATHTFDVPEDTTEVHVSLTWTDPPANPSAQTTIVNDLDLLVEGPGGVPLYWGNFGLNQAEYSLPGIPDRLNTIEKVVIPGTALAGLDTLTATVIGAGVNEDAEPGTSEVDQAYALAVVPVFE